jgi:hypothetical protein
MRLAHRKQPLAVRHARTVSTGSPPRGDGAGYFTTITPDIALPCTAQS